MILNFIDEVLADVPKFIITHADNSQEEVSIDLATTVTTEGTPLDKVLFDKIDKYLVPAGVITMWSGSINNIPVGWALCNGQNGTPDLRNRFIVGSGDEYAVGSTGGEKEHSISINELPAHSHNIVFPKPSGGVRPNHRDTFYAGGSALSYGDFSNDWNGNNTVPVSNTGSGQACENRPPYYSLAYIMKISN